MSVPVSAEANRDRSPVTFRVTGRPRTKGSLKVITPRGRKPVLAEDHAHSEPWRKQIRKAILEQVSYRRGIDYPVVVECTFLFARTGPSAQDLPFPTVNAGVNANGDLDKLVRNLLDAMQDSGLIVNDAQVVGLVAYKMWAPLEPCLSVTVRDAENRGNAEEWF